MSTAAIFEEPHPPRLLVVRTVAAPAPGREDSEQSGDTVVRLPSRSERGRLSEVKGPASSVRVLDPAASDREVVRALSAKIAQAVLEILSGVRSVQQLSRWLDTMCLSALTIRARLHADAYKAQARRLSHDPGCGTVVPLHHQPIVHSVHCSPVSPGIFETSVVIADKTRFRAVAIRFECCEGLWKVTALQIG